MLRIIKLVDVPAGSNEAKITRQLNGETITVTWDITRPLSEGLDDDEDAFGDDDDEDDEDAVAAKKSAKKMDSHEDEEAEDEDEDEMEEPLALTVDITKPDMGTLSFFCEYSGDMQSISIRDVEFTADSSLTDATSAQKEHERRQTYVGPHFDELDWELQDAFQDYLEKRGVDGEVLGGFIADFADWKEQVEYTNWLQKVKQFVEKSPRQ